jgi:hypothetical protein
MFDTIGKAWGSAMLAALKIEKLSRKFTKPTNMYAVNFAQKSVNC